MISDASATTARHDGDAMMERSDLNKPNATDLHVFCSSGRLFGGCVRFQVDSPPAHSRKLLARHRRALPCSLPCLKTCHRAVQRRTGQTGRETMLHEEHALWLAPVAPPELPTCAFVWRLCVDRDQVPCTATRFQHTPSISHTQQDWQEDHKTSARAVCTDSQETGSVCHERSVT